jgi:hypothetical protein
MQLLYQLGKARRLNCAGELRLRPLAVIFEPGAVRSESFCKTQLGGALSQAAHLYVEVTRGTKLAGDPAEPVVQAACFGGQHIAEQA